MSRADLRQRWWNHYGDAYHSPEAAADDFDRYLAERALFAGIFETRQ